MLWEPRSEVYFAQKGNQMGKYLMKDNWSVEQCANQSIWTLNLKSDWTGNHLQNLWWEITPSQVKGHELSQWTVNNLVRILNPISFKAWIHHIKVQKLQCTLVNFVAFKVWFFADWFILDCRRPKWSCFIMDFLSKDFPTKWCEKKMRSCESMGTPPANLTIDFLHAQNQKGVLV